MLSKNDFIADPAKQQVLITRIFEAPIDLVFSMWTNPKYLAIWWGPEKNTNPVCEMDVRPGGTIRIAMQMENRQLVHVTGIFNEVSPPHRLVFTTLKDENGKAGLEVLHTVILTEANGHTKLCMEVTIIKTSPEFMTSCQGMESGWNQSFDRLTQLLILENNKPIKIKR